MPAVPVDSRALLVEWPREDRESSALQIFFIASTGLHVTRHSGSDFQPTAFRRVDISLCSSYSAMQDHGNRVREQAPRVMFNLLYPVPSVAVASITDRV